MTRPFRPADFTPRIAAGANLAVAEGRGLLTRLAPSVGPAETAAVRTLRFRLSDGTVDRYGDRIDPAGWRLANFKRNPVVLFAHDDKSPPIGRAVSIGVQDGALIAELEFAPAEASPFADTVFRMLREGFLNACSVGFLPIDWNYSSDKSRAGGIDFLVVELLEVSVVPIPALPTALVQARAAGVDTSSFADWAARQLQRERNPMNRATLETVKQFAPSPVRRSAGPFAQPAAPNAAATGEWESLAHFARAVATAKDKTFAARPDPRMVRAPVIRAPSGVYEADPTSGGYLVPPGFAEELIGSLYEFSPILPLCDRRETERAANFSLPVIDETSRANGSRWGGVQSYFEGEGYQPATTLPKFKSLKFESNKLIGLCVTSTELLNDAPALETHLMRAYSSEAAWQLERAVLTGSGGPNIALGITNAGGTIAIAKQAGQASGTIISDNLRAAWARIPGPCRRRAVVIGCEDCEQQIAQAASAATAETAGMYFPAGAAGNEFPLVFGRPLIVSDVLPTLGTPGDIIIADLSQYVIVDSGMRSALSLDVEFLNYQAVFKFTYRVSGQPIWQAPITPYNGALPRSPYVMLGQR